MDDNRQPMTPEQSLALLEADFVRYHPAEQAIIKDLRERIRVIVSTYGAPGALAVIATSFEIAIAGGVK